MIQIAFCFDENMINAACVAIASLLDFKGEEDKYFIHCICSSKVLECSNLIQQIVNARDTESKIEFIKAPDYFNQSYEVRGISTSTYLRLALHRILPQLDKVIYADVDVLVNGSLCGMWNYELGYNLLAGIKGANNFSDAWEKISKLDYANELLEINKKYINAGILLMNLRAIREMNPDRHWNSMSNQKYHFQDQDILNITCKGRISYLSLMYNVPAHLEKKVFFRFSEEDIYSIEICEAAWNRPVIIHYTGEKPWKNRGTHKAKCWWDYVESQADLKILFDKRTVKNRKTTGIIGKINRHLPF